LRGIVSIIAEGLSRVRLSTCHGVGLISEKVFFRGIWEDF
jgi:hypothetical protein